MALEVGDPQTPEWWLFRLGKRLSADTPKLLELDAFDRGDHPLPFGDRRCKPTYERFQKEAQSNFVGLVAESVLERLTVTGFRMGGQGEASADDRANLIWQANQLDADSTLVHRAALVKRRAYVIVGPDPSNPSKPIISPEDPLEVIHESDPLYRRRIRAALKTWTDDVEGARFAIVYLPKSLHYYRSPIPSSSSAEIWDPARWDMWKDPAANIMGEVPVVPFINRPSIDRFGMGEFEDVLPIQKRINATLLHRLVVTAMQSFRQRWGKGVTTTDEDGNESRPFDAGADLLWLVEDENAQFGDFAQADLQPILSSIQHDIRDLAAITRTPPHYLLGEIVNASGDALKAAETGLVSKAKERMRQFGESWEQAMRLAFRVSGFEDAAVDAETLWADPESRSMAELADASVKKQAAGVPWRQRMVDLGYTPSVIDRMEAERAQDALLAGLGQPASNANSEPVASGQ